MATKSFDYALRSQHCSKVTGFSIRNLALSNLRRILSRTGIFVCALAIAMSLTETSNAQVVEWIRTLGHDSLNEGNGVVTDGVGNIYIAGRTTDTIGAVNFGKSDAIVSKYDSTGALQWSTQIGTAEADLAYGITLDQSGGIYIAGLTDGSLGTPLGQVDAFVAKLNENGALLWTKQFGTNEPDIAKSISADGLGNVYVTGWTEGSLGASHKWSYDVFLSKYDSSGTPIWNRQIGTMEEDQAHAVSTDLLGNIYIAGYSTGDLGGGNAGHSDAFVAKYDSSGNQIWITSLGSNNLDQARGIVVDNAGNVFITGRTEGNLGGPNAGGTDAFLSKLDGAGNQQWSRQLGTSLFDDSYGITVDPLGNVLISGVTGGTLGESSLGLQDVLVAAYDTAGNQLWIEQFGTNRDDRGLAIAADGLGNAYITGFLNDRVLFAGDPHEMFLAKIVIPEPSGITLALVSFALLVAGRPYFLSRRRIGQSKA
ncbi:MAG: SBBP repeat-containing protein [Planctomycetota bacterium]|nr:SBBP repeat-containing protein [Planctomycetota bacterium]